MTDDLWVGLAEAVRSIRSELIAAMSEGEGQPLRFELGTIELELAVDVRKEIGAEGGFRVFVASAQAKGGMSHASANRLRVSLSPRSQGRSAEIAGEDSIRQFAHGQRRGLAAADD